MSAPRSSGSTVSRVDGDTPGHQRDTGTGVEWDGGLEPPAFGADSKLTISP